MGHWTTHRSRRPRNASFQPDHRSLELLAPPPSAVLCCLPPLSLDDSATPRHDTTLSSRRYQDSFGPERSSRRCLSTRGLRSRENRRPSPCFDQWRFYAGNPLTLACNHRPAWCDDGKSDKTGPSFGQPTGISTPVNTRLSPFIVPQARSFWPHRIVALWPVSLAFRRQQLNIRSFIRRASPHRPARP